MRASSRFVVPGEDLPMVVALAFAAVALASAAGGVAAWPKEPPPSASQTAQAASAAREPAAPIASAAPQASAPVASAAPSSVPDTSDADASAAPAASARTASACPPLIVNFQAGMASAPHTADAAVASLAVWLLANPAATVVIDGHADARGSEDGNLHLSRQRALLLSAALERVGIARSRITTRGFGSFWPVDEAPADASWNRRAVIHTRGPACPRAAEEVIEP